MDSFKVFWTNAVTILDDPCTLQNEISIYSASTTVVVHYSPCDCPWYGTGSGTRSRLWRSHWLTVFLLVYSANFYWWLVPLHGPCVLMSAGHCGAGAELSSPRIIVCPGVAVQARGMASPTNLFNTQVSVLSSF